MALHLFATLCYLLAFVSSLAVSAHHDVGDVSGDLRHRLSACASFSSTIQRWSNYRAPHPGLIVNVCEEMDVAATVAYCVAHHINFLAQSGGHGWATTFSLDRQGVIINMRGLNKVRVNKAGDRVTFGGGALISEVVEAAYKRRVEVPTGNCNCVGMLGAVLGGELGRLMGRYGLGVDDLLSVNMVTASGKLITVSPASPHEGLWWGLRGAGANLGIVTSATMKAYPTTNNGIAWTGNLIYPPSKLEAVVKAINDIYLAKEMSIHLYYAAAPPTFSPTLIVNPWFSGNATAGRAAFATFYDLGPVADTTKKLPYNKINSDADFFCVKGGRKAPYSTGLRRLDPIAYRRIWNEYIAFLKNNPGAEQTSILTECYSQVAMRAVDYDSTAFPHRDVNFHGFVVPWYNNSGMDAAAEAFGRKVRGIWDESSGFEIGEHTYINFAHGDESLETIYGPSLDRLRRIKRRWDPLSRFNQFFPITQEKDEKVDRRDLGASEARESTSYCPVEIPFAHAA